MRQQTSKLKKVGLKVTFPRLKVLQIMAESEQRHMSAEDVYKALQESGDEIGIATVYRVLMQLDRAGLLESHKFNNDYKVYELDKGDHHDHMVCVETGDVIEFHNEKIEQLQKNIAQELGYEITGHSLVLYGKPVKVTCDLD